jgi:DNA polymerase III subunit delta
VTRAPRVVLLHGEEPFLVGEEARRLIAAWTSDLVSDFGYEALDTSGLTADRLRDAILQAPFLDPHRVVAVRGIPARSADKLAAALSEVPPSTHLLLTVNGRLGSASRLLKAVASLEAGQARELPPLKGRALNDWVYARAREHGLAPPIAAAVLRSSRSELAVIDSELRKLAAYRATGAELDQEALSALLAGGRQDEIFRLTDLVLPRPKAEAWRVLDGLLERESPTTVAYRLARHLALVLEVRTRQDRGETLAEAQAAMKEHRFVVQKAYDAAGLVSAEQLERGLNALLAYEWEVKSGQVDAELGLGAALAKL